MTDFLRVELARVMEDTVKAKARERKTAGVNQYTESLPEIFPGGKDARDELGAMAGVSGKTYEHAAAVIESAPAPIVEAARNQGLLFLTTLDLTAPAPPLPLRLTAFPLRHGIGVAPPPIASYRLSMGRYAPLYNRSSPGVTA